jgi:hypothetical protein
VWAEAIAFIFIVVLRLLSYARGWTGVAVDEFAPDFTPVIAKPVRRAANKMQRGRSVSRQPNTDDPDDDGPPETAPLPD